MADSHAGVPIILFCAIYAFCLGSLAAPDGAGFSVELIHRDSPRSPLHDSAETPAQRFENAVRRSISRANHFSSLVSSPGSEPYVDLRSDEGEYLMEIEIGTPPVHLVGFADTGSDLTWTQCPPCDRCFKQVAPLFDPKKSSTYRDISCSSAECSFVPKKCTNESGPCQYSLLYGGGASTKGNLAMDTVTLGSTSSGPFVLPQTIIGCGHNNRGPFDEKTWGIIGLGGGPASLASQLGKAIGRRSFSYCLVQYNATTSSSRLNFGSKAEVTGPGTVSTPLAVVGSTIYYYITLEAVSVGKDTMKYEASLAGSGTKGDIIIDSGTTLTVMPEDFYSWMESAVAKRIALTPMKNPPSGMKLCYKSPNDIEAPVITFHFEGADVTLGYMNTFYRVDHNVVCFAFIPTTNTLYVYGNLAQTNFLIGYDKDKGTVSFKPTDCTKFK